MSNDSRMITIGGWSLIAFTVLYLGLQVYLRVVFDFFALLHGPIISELPKLLAGGQHLVIVLTIFSLLPLLLIPGSVGAYVAFKNDHEAHMRLATVFATITAIAFTLSAMQWPSVYLNIAGVYAAADAGQRGVLLGVLMAFNSYIGVYIGGFLASLSACIWFFITGMAMIKTRLFPQWMGYVGVIAAVYMLIAVIDRLGIFPDFISGLISDAAPIDAIWLLVFGIGLLMHRKAS